MSTTSQLLALEVPRHHVKTVKSALESKGLRGRSCKIDPKPCLDGKSRDIYLLQTLLETNENVMTDVWKEDIFRDLGILDLKDDIKALTYKCPTELLQDIHKRKQVDLSDTMRQYLFSLGPHLLERAEYDLNTLLHTIPTSYTKLGPLLILPQHFWSTSEWTDLLQNRLTVTQYSSLLDHIATTLSTTHIARQTPIPAHLSSTTTPNTQRRPHLEPLKGSFGPFVRSSPTPKDFDEAFWVTVKQNGITQIFAPQYTMFSRGNVKEKARLLSLPSIVLPPPEGARGQAAVDMYAGIGYFAFSYVRAGVDKVVAFDLNPWSVEGFRRGAGANGWGVMCGDEEGTEGEFGEWDLDEKVRFLLFCADNRYVGKVLNALRHRLPPIRHVNLGLLPDSRQGWSEAVGALDYFEGGWLHVHQTIREGDLDVIPEAVRKEIETLAVNRWNFQGEVNGQAEITTCEVVLDHVEKVKSYAPGEFRSLCYQTLF